MGLSGDTRRGVGLGSGRGDGPLPGTVLADVPGPSLRKCSHVRRTRQGKVPGLEHLHAHHHGRHRRGGGCVGVRNMSVVVAHGGNTSHLLRLRSRVISKIVENDVEENFSHVCPISATDEGSSWVRTEKLAIVAEGERHEPLAEKHRLRSDDLSRGRMLLGRRGAHAP